MKHFYLATIFACTVAVSLPANAAMSGMQKHTASASERTSKTRTFMGHGQINSVHSNASMVNITMDAVPALGWPRMPMGFRVYDKAMLNHLMAGAMVNFIFAKDTAGGYVITKIMPVGH